MASPLDFDLPAGFTLDDEPETSSVAPDLPDGFTLDRWEPFSGSPSFPDPAKTGLLPEAPKPAPSPRAPTKDTRQPASIRFANPGAMYPGPSSEKFGATATETIGGGHKIAVFPDMESGAAAQFDLLDQGYTGLSLRDALRKWSGGNNADAYTAAVSSATGLAPDTVLTGDMIRDPSVAVPLAKAMARVEAGADFPMSDDEWQRAHARAFGAPIQTAATPSGTQPTQAPRNSTDLLRAVLGAPPEQRRQIVEDYLFESLGVPKPQRELPSGFTLDAEPGADAALPPGFTLDEGADDEPEAQEAGLGGRISGGFLEGLALTQDALEMTGLALSGADNARLAEAISDNSKRTSRTSKELQGLQERIQKAAEPSQGAWGRGEYLTSVKGLWDTLVAAGGEFVSDPVSFAEFAAQAMGTSIVPIASMIVGGLGGSVVPVFGSTGGAIAGGFVGSAALEFGLWMQQTISDKVIEKGGDPSDVSAVAEVLNDPEVKSEIQKEAATKGLTHAAVGAVLDRVAAGILRFSPKTRPGRVARTTAAGGVEVASEGGEEAVSQVAATGDFDVADVALEMAGGVGAGAAQTGVLSAAERARRAVRERRGSSGTPEQSPTESPAPEPPTPAAPAAEAPAAEPAPVPAPPPATAEDAALLRAQGWTDEEIADMDPTERAEEIAAAREQGVTPQPLAPDQPTAEPSSDLVAQARDLANPDNPRRGLYVPRSSLETLLNDPDGANALANALEGKAVSLDNFDDQGGMLVVPDNETAQWAVEQKDSGRNLQDIIGELTGAGRGKPIDGTHAVQQVTPEGAVTRESLVTADEVAATEEEFAEPGRDVRTIAPEEALRRREEEIAAQEATPVGDGSRAKPVKVQAPEDIARASERVQEPTEAQAEAGNYPKGHVDFQGLQISVETPKGGTRRGVKDGKELWRVENMPAAYGYFKGVPARAKDKEHVDVYVGDNVQSDRAFIVDQHNLDGAFDEPKVVIGVNTAQEAAAIYDAGFSDGRGPERRRGISEVSLDELKEWLQTGDATKPFAREAERETAPEPEPAAAPVEAAEAPETGPSDSGATFQTAKGSRYTVQPDGTTVRDKAARDDIGHEGDSGTKPKSETTFYVTPENVEKLGEFQAKGGPRRALGFPRPGYVGVWYLDGKDRGKFERRTVVPYKLEPQIGLIPVEMWDQGQRVHFGNEIVSVGKKAEPAPAEKSSAKKPRLGTTLDTMPQEDKGKVKAAVDRVRGESEERPEPVAEAPAEPVEPETKPAVQEAAEPAEAVPEPAEASETADPLSALVVVLRGAGFKTIVEARKFVKDAGIVPADASNKQVDETIESAVVAAARQIVAEGGTPAEIYQHLVELYGKQPNLGTRTSTSVANQAYSTPVPLAYISSRLARIASADVVYEPTAGNGALLIEAGPGNDAVHANELDPARAAELERQGFDVTTEDATERAHVKAPADAIVMNPPFGAVREGGKSKDWTIDGWTTSQVDHAIALQSLKAMTDDGRAVLILGGIKAESIEERRKGYRGKAKREFYFRLYNQYNVTDHFTVDGDLYAKQGAGWPVDVVVIEGRGKSERALPAAQPPIIFKDWDSLAEKLPDATATAQIDTAEVGRPVEPSRRPSGEVGGAPSRDEVSSPETGRGRPERLLPETGDDAVPVRGDGDSGQPGDVRGGRRDELPAVSRPDPDTRRADKPAPAERVRSRVKREVRGGQATYEPVSATKPLDTLIPVNMADAARSAMERIEQRHGGVDEFVADRLGYDPKDLSKYFGAEQIDAIAAAIDNIERGSAFVSGDMTGVGKGRQAAGLLRYAMRQGKIPVLVTEKPDLYGDMWRDMRDIGLPEMLGREPRIFMTNTGASVTLDEEALAWKQEADAAREAGQPIPKRRGRFLTGGTAARQSSDMRAIAKGEGNYDVVFTTYDQMNTVKGQTTPRRQFLAQIASNSLIVFDESHNAGGAGQSGWKSKDAESNRSQFARDLARDAWGVMFASATYAKRPDVMDLYARTDMGKAVDDPKMLPELIAKGGVPMQQIVATMLADSGQYMRRERSFEGVEYAVEGVPVNPESYRQFSDSVRAVFQFDLALQPERKKLFQAALDAAGKTVAKDAGVGDMAAHTTAFASVMHNIVNQMLLSIKTNEVAKRAIAAHKAGEKPVIGLSSTMEAFITDFAAGEGITVGEAIDLSFRDVLARYLRRTLRVSVKTPDGKTEHIQISADELPSHLQRMYRDALDIINEGDYEGLPISPIDAIRHQLTKAGLKVSEITGRQTMIDYSESPPRYVARPKREMGPSGKRGSISAFNRGALDALIINRSGSTGVSMHASASFRDKRRRRMILAQAEGNIDTHLQMLGRVHRTGQVVPPAYSQIAAEIPAEARPTAVLMRKMASLNANTTGARGSVFMSDAVDFINEVGDRVVAGIVEEDPEIAAMLGNPLKTDNEGNATAEDAAKRVTGRLTLLTPEKQTELLDRISSAYKSEIEQLDALGENPLEAKTLDLQARTLDSTEIKPRQGDSPFLEAVSLEKVSVKAQGRAMAPDEVAKRVAETLKAEKPGTDPASSLGALERQGQDWARETWRTVGERARGWIAREVAETSDQAKASTESRHQDTLARWRAALQVAYPGARVRLGMPAGDVSGVVLKVERTGKAKNPVALGSWEVRIAVPESDREYIFPMSKLFPPGITKSEDEKGATIERDNTSFADLMPKFEEARREGRENRFVFTGNILAAYDQTAGRGRIINFTTESGELRPGILMGREFSQTDFMESRKVRFHSGDQVAQFLSRVPEAEIKSTDGLVTLRLERDGLSVLTPASRATGGRVYTDPDVRRAVGVEFERRNNQMVARGISSGRTAQIVDAIRGVGAIFETRESQEVAQEIVGAAGASQAVRDFANAVDSLKQELGVETRSMASDAQSRRRMRALIDTGSASLKQQVEKIRRGSRLKVVVDHVSGFTSDASRILAVVQKNEAVDLSAATVADMQQFLSSLSDLAQIVEDRLQKGYVLVDEVAEIRDVLLERIENTSYELEQITGDADLLMDQLSERAEEIDEALDELGDPAPEEDVEETTALVPVDRRPSLLAQAQRPIPEEASFLDVAQQEVATSLTVLKTLDEKVRGVLALDVSEMNDEAALERAREQIDSLQTELMAVREWTNTMSGMASGKAGEVLDILDNLTEERLSPALDNLEEAQGDIGGRMDEVEERLTDQREIAAGEVVEVDGERFGPTRLRQEIADQSGMVAVWEKTIREVEAGERSDQADQLPAFRAALEGHRERRDRLKDALDRFTGEKGGLRALADAPTRERDPVDRIKARMLLRQPVDLSEEADTVLSVLRAEDPPVPGLIRETVVSAIKPRKGKPDQFIVTVRDTDGAEYEIVEYRDDILRSDGLFDFLPDGTPFIAFFDFDLRGDFVQRLRGKRAHEWLHGLRALGHLPGRVGDAASPWGRLVRHAENLGVMEGTLYDHLTRIEHPRAENVRNRDATIFETYHRAYRTRKDYREAMGQESVAHMVQQYVHGVLSEQDVAPVRDILAGLVTPRTDLALAAGDKLFQIADQRQSSFTPRFEQSRAEVAERLVREFERMVPSHVRVVVRNRIERDGFGLHGYFSGRRGILAIALAYGPEQALETGKHEVVHAARYFDLFTDREWRLLVDHARKTLVGKSVTLSDQDGQDLWAIPFYRKLFEDRFSKRGFEGTALEAEVRELLDQELVANMAERWSMGDERFTGRIDKLLKRLSNFLEALRNALSGAGFQTVDDVFQRLFSGDIAARADITRGRGGGPMFSLLQEDRWPISDGGYAGKVRLGFLAGDETRANAFRQAAVDSPDATIGPYTVRRIAKPKAGAVTYEMFDGEQKIGSAIIDPPRRLTPKTSDMLLSGERSFAKLEKKQPLAGTVTRIEINDDRQGQGLGSSLLDLIEGDLRAVGAILHPGDTNMTEDFIRLYAKRDPDMLRDAFERMGLDRYSDPALMLDRAVRERSRTAPLAERLAMLDRDEAEIRARYAEELKEVSLFDRETRATIRENMENELAGVRRRREALLSQGPMFSLVVPTAPRQFGIPKEADPPISSHSRDDEIKAHPDYRAAKAGDREAAARMVPDVVKPETVEEARRRFGPDVIYVPVIAEEATGRNKIPEGIAHYYAVATGAGVTDQIVQVSRAYHTGARPLERLISRPLFSGPVERGRRYVLVDDVSVMGGTLAEFANHILSNGGEVAGVVTLVNASRSTIFTPRPNQLRQMEARYGEIIRAEFGIEPAALTADEAVYILGFRNADGLRDSIAKAGGERDQRLLSKGIRPPASEGAASLVAQLSPETRRTLSRDLTDAINIVGRIAGKDVEVAFFDRIPAEIAAGTAQRDATARLGVAAQTAGGFYQPGQVDGRALIGLATNDPAYDLRTNAGHEAWHHVEESLATDPELRLIRLPSEMARTRRLAAAEIGMEPGDPRLDNLPDKEIRAIAFQRYRRMREEGAQPSGIHIGVRRFWDRIIRILRAVQNVVSRNVSLREALAGAGSTEAIFERARRGEMAGRPVPKASEARDALADATVPGLIRQGVADPSAGTVPALSLPGVTTPHPSAQAVMDALAESQAQGSPDTQANIIPNQVQPQLTPQAVIRRGSRRTLSRVMNATDRSRVKVQDKVLPIRRYQEKLERESGTKLPVNLDVYLAEALYHGRAGERMMDVRAKFIEPLMDGLRAAGIEFDQFGDYLYARHAAERNAAIREIDPDNDSGSGMTDAEAAAILDRVRQSGKKAQYDEAAAIVDGMLEDTRNVLLRAGLIDRETYDDWKNKYQSYVPLRGFEITEDESSPDFPRVGRGFDVRGPEAFRALGRRSKADNPVLYAVMQAQQAIVRAEKNRVDKTLYRQIQAHPDPSVWRIYKGERKRRVNPETGLVETYWVPPSFVHRDNLHGVKIGGKQHWIEIKHSGLARAVRGVGSELQGTILGRAMFKAARTYAGLLTSYNPEFLFSNFFRDVQTALVNVSDVAERPEGTRRKIIKEALSLKSIRGALAAVRDYEGRTIFGTRRAADETILGMKKSQASQEYARWYEEFRQAGGKISFMEYNDVQKIRNDITRSLGQGRTMRAFRNTARLVEDLNTAVENGVRLSVYKTLRENGVAQDRAAFVARELTVNFNRKGEWGPAINAAYLFFNASVQGTTRIAQAVTRSKAVRWAVGSIFATGIALDLLNFLIAGDDDDGENAYDKIPDWVKERNLIVMIPGDPDNGYLQIPLAYGYNVPFLAGQQAMSVLRGVQKPLKAAATVAVSAWDAFNPIGSAPSVTQFISPTFIDPFVQVIENKTWYGGPIFPTKFNKHQPWSETYKSSTPGWAKDVAQIVNRATFGNQARSGFFDWSPDVLEHYLEFAMGGAGKFVLNAINSGQRVVSSDEWLPEKTPFVRRLFGKTTTVSRYREFYEAWDDVDAAFYEVRTLSKEGDREGATAARREFRPELTAYPMMKAANKTLRDMRKLKDRIEADGNLSSEEKRKRVDEIRKKENALILRALRVYSEAQRDARRAPAAEQ